MDEWKIKRSLRAAMALAVGLAAVAGVATQAAPAQAADYVACPDDNALCFWAGTWGWNQTNPATDRSKYVLDNTSFVGGVVGPNDDESWLNDGTQYVRIYNGTSWTGGVTVCLSADGWLGSSTTAANKGESNKWSASIPC